MNNNNSLDISQKYMRLLEIVRNSYDPKKAQENMEDCLHINCYGWARQLTYLDKEHLLYYPGMFKFLQTGGKCEVNLYNDQIDPVFLDQCIRADSEALQQPCTRVSIDSIKDEDKNFYFGLAIVHTLQKQINVYSILQQNKLRYSTKKQWHFICRTADGVWLHKPNWQQSVEKIYWKENENKSKFIFYNLASLNSNIMLQVEGIVQPDYFYRIDI
jgi:hypothetical protein